MEELDEEDQPKDLIQVTWEQIPKIIPVFRKTLDEKKAYLSDSEIIELKNIMTDFREIRSEIKTLIMLSPLLHNVLNHPDEEILSNQYATVSLSKCDINIFYRKEYFFACCRINWSMLRK